MTREEFGKGSSAFCILLPVRNLGKKHYCDFFEQTGSEWDFGKYVEHLSAKL